MIPAPVPANEAERLEALRHYRLHITGREPEFERIARQVSELFGTPIALVSLVLDEEQRFMGTCGLDLRVTPRDFAFCTHALAGEEVLVVPDARTDPRFARNPLVTGPPHIHSYAGAPLLIEPGVVVGTLCAIGTEPRDFTAAERRRLAALAETVVDLVRLRLGALMKREAEESRDAAARQLEEALDAMPAALAVYDEGGLLLRINRAFRETLFSDEAEALRPGMTPAEVWRVMGSRGHRIRQSGAQAEWLHGDPKGSRAPRGSFEIHLADGRFLHGSETRTP